MFDPPGVGGRVLGLPTALATACLFVIAAAVPANSAEIQTYATIHSVGVRLFPLRDEVAGARLMYRRSGTAGWQRAMDPVITVANHTLEQGSLSLEVVTSDVAPMIRRLHGSIMHLQPATEYELRLETINLDGSFHRAHECLVKTRPSAVSRGNGRRITVDQNGAGDYQTISGAIASASPGDIVTVMPGIYSASIMVGSSGEPGNPVTIRGTKGAILDDARSGKFLIQFPGGCHDVVFGDSISEPIPPNAGAMFAWVQMYRGS